MTSEDLIDWEPIHPHLNPRSTKVEGREGQKRRATKLGVIVKGNHHRPEEAISRSQPTHFDHG